MRGVLNQEQALSASEGLPGVTIREIAAKMYEYAGFGALRTLGFRLIQRHQGKIWRFDIDEDRPCSYIEHAIGGCDERQRWNKNFIARPDAKRVQDQMESRGA